VESKDLEGACPTHAIGAVSTTEARTWRFEDFAQT